jgi:hypothetical protein
MPSWIGIRPLSSTDRNEKTAAVADGQHGERRRLRSFGLTVGAAFLILAGFLLWKGKPTGPYFGGLGALLALTGWLAPTLLRPIERVWMIGARAMGWVMTRVILSLVFVLIFAPAGLVLRLLRKDPLQLRFDAQASSYWHDRDEAAATAERMERMF